MVLVWSKTDFSNLIYSFDAKAEGEIVTNMMSVIDQIYETCLISFIFCHIFNINLKKCH